VPVAEGVARFLGSTRLCPALYLIDGDAYEPRNRERVRVEAYENKAVAKARELARASDGRPAILPVAAYVTRRNAGRLLGEGDVVFACVDNHASRKVVGDRCRRLENAVVISGGNDGVEAGRTGTGGNVQVYVRRDGRDVTNPLTRYHPEIARPRDRPPRGPGCDEAPATPQLLFTNLTVAAAMLATFHAWLTETLDYEEIYLDIALGRMTPVQRAVAGPRGLRTSNE
jgi:molybdopterin/thiamine biosynthesis adenylyltransferase